MITVPPDVAPLFEAAGWSPERWIAVPAALIERVPVGHPSLEVLSRFGGLRVDGAEAGQECAPDDIQFMNPSEDLSEGVDPDYFLGQAEVKTWNKLLDTCLVLVADNGGGDLLIDTRGRCFGLSGIHDAFYFCGESFGEAMQRLLWGRRSRPMLRLGQISVSLYGRYFNAQSPELYRYDEEKQ